jgi:flagellar motor switch protein FliG
VPTGEDKVALLLSSLSPPVVESVLSRMPAELTERLRARLKTLADAPKEQVEEAAIEFVDLFRISERVPNLMPPAPFAPSAHLETQAGAESPPAPPEPPQEEESDAVKALRALSPSELLLGLKDEQPATVAIVLGCLDLKTTAEVLRQLPPDIRHGAALRLARPVSPSREVVAQVSRAVLNKCKQAAEEPEPSNDEKLMRLADVIRSLGREDRQVILDKLSKNNTAAAETIKKQLYRFSDLLRIDDRGLQGILSQLDMKTLAAAVKNADPAVKEKVLTNVSRRAREAVTEELELSASLPKSQSDEAQDRILEIVRTMDQDGKLNMEPIS